MQFFSHIDFLKFIRYHIFRALRQADMLISERVSSAMQRYRKAVAQLQFHTAERMESRPRTAGRGETQPARYGVGTKAPDHTPTG